MKIKIEVELDEDFLAGVMTTALEGGIGYWSKCSHVKRREDLWITSCRIYEFDDDEDVPEGAEGVPLTLKHIGLGIERLVSGEVGVNSTLRGYISQGVAEKDAGHIDADAADVIVQAGLLGEIRYG